MQTIPWIRFHPTRKTAWLIVQIANHLFTGKHSAFETFTIFAAIAPEDRGHGTLNRGLEQPQVPGVARN